MIFSNVLSRRNRILLKELVITDFKLRYQGSVLGYLWSLLKPLMLFTIMYFVFVRFLKFGEGIPHFEVALLLGLVLWTFFTEATMQGMQSIVARGDLIRKIDIPKYIIVISGTISALINMSLNLIVVFAFILLNGVDLTWNVLLLPINILELFVLALSLAFILGAVYVKFRDIAPIWEVISQGLFYATPIIYPLSMVMSNSNDMIAKVLMLNPVAMIIQDARYNAISQETVTTSNLINNPFIAAIPHIIIGVLLVVAVVYFRRSQKYFAENV